MCTLSKWACRLSLLTAWPASVGVIEEEARCTFRPQINAASEQLLEDSLQVPANFYERQRFFYDIRQERLQRLQTELVCPQTITS